MFALSIAHSFAFLFVLRISTVAIGNKLEIELAASVLADLLTKETTVKALTLITFSYESLPERSMNSSSVCFHFCDKLRSAYFDRLRRRNLQSLDVVLSLRTPMTEETKQLLDSCQPRLVLACTELNAQDKNVLHSYQLQLEATVNCINLILIIFGNKKIAPRWTRSSKCHIQYLPASCLYLNSSSTSCRFTLQDLNFTVMKTIQKEEECDSFNNRRRIERSIESPSLIQEADASSKGSEMPHYFLGLCIAIFPLTLCITISLYLWLRRYYGLPMFPWNIERSGPLCPVIQITELYRLASTAGGYQTPRMPGQLKVAEFRENLVFLRPIKVGTDKTQMLKEAEELRQHIDNENVLKIFAICLEYEKHSLALVLEFCYYGTLKETIAANMSRDLNENFILDLAEGLQAIHDSAYQCHGLLKSTHCFVNARFTVKIGLQFAFPSVFARFAETQEDSEIMDELYVRSQRQCNESHSKNAYDSLLWTAPELLRQLNVIKYEQRDLEVLIQKKRKHKSCIEELRRADIYSLGIIMHECLEMQGTFPLRKSTRGFDGHRHFSSKETIQMVAAQTRNVTRPDTYWIILPAYAQKLLPICWHDDPKNRPNLPLILKQLRNVICFDKINYASRIDEQMKERKRIMEEVSKLTPGKIAEVVDGLLPRQIKLELQTSKNVEMRSYSCVTILFADCTGFGELLKLYSTAADGDPGTIVHRLNQIFTILDNMIAKLQKEEKVYKVETIGEQYMLVSGLPKELTNHTEIVAKVALDMMEKARETTPLNPGAAIYGACLQFRVGVHTGPVVAGMIGLTLPRYRLFGDTVNYASRIQVYGYPGLIHVSEETAAVLKATNRYIIERRGTIEIKGKGIHTTYWLRCHNDALPLPETDSFVKLARERDARKEFKMPLGCKLLSRLKHGRVITDKQISEHDNDMTAASFLLNMKPETPASSVYINHSPYEIVEPNYDRSAISVKTQELQRQAGNLVLGTVMSNTTLVRTECI